MPTLVLQPLVENAIHHGIAARAEGGSIAIRARREDDALLISVADDGIGGNGADMPPRGVFVVLKDGTKLTMSRRYRTQIREVAGLDI